MSAPITIPVSEKHDSPSLRNLSPIILSYLQTVSTGIRPLGPSQKEELAKSPYDKKFLQYMSSAESDALKPIVAFDLDQSISNYFVNSSHNTYLTGNQLYSDSSTAPYTNAIKALLRGCRCIEVDVWDGEPRSSSADPQRLLEKERKHRFTSYIPKVLSRHSSEERKSRDTSSASTDPPLQMPTPWISASTATRAEPRVLHGYTLTKEIPFRNVCAAIMDAAFINSDLPVIISLEVHASASQQEIMVEIIKSSFKGHLVSPVSDENPPLPTPASLRKKILIKVKYVNPKKAVSKAQGEDSKLEVPSLYKRKSTTFSSSSSSDNDAPTPKLEKQKKKKKPSIITSLSALGVYTRSYHFSGLDSPEALIPTHIFSISEKKLMELHQSSGPTLFSHNRDFLMRAYPSGLRVRSDNLDPGVFWRKGVQIVALNWQRWDEGMMLNEAMFDGSGGWVLKPAGYLSTNIQNSNRSLQAREVKGIGTESQVDAICRKTLTLAVTILAAQDIPLPPDLKHVHSFQPYIKVELHVEKPSERTGAPIENDGKSKDDEEDGKYKHTIRPGSKGRTEVDFHAVRIEFNDIPGVIEELGFLRFKVQNDEFGKDALAAWACIRLDRLKEGWRFVHLLDAEGKKGPGVVLVGIEKKLV